MSVINQLSVGEVVSTFRDVLTILGIVVVGWKARDIFQDAKEFFADIKEFIKDSRSFMDRMDKVANVAVNNHLRHIEESVCKTAVRIDPLLEESNEEH